MKIKGFDENLKCREYQFEIGKTYNTKAKKGDLNLCSNTVFHYANSIQQVHSFYKVGNHNRFCEIEVLGHEISDESKCGSNKIKIVREIIGKELDELCGKINGNTGLFNSGDSNSGDSNSGDRNSGDSNSGYRNSGDSNSGDRNSGDSNSGYSNSGYRNSGDSNSGYRNSGDSNSGYRNSGDRNSGYRNSGYRNSGDSNSGYRNSGDSNSGYRNSGYSNSGDSNSGDRNSGSWNSCNRSSGFFNSKNEIIRVFNKQCNKKRWENSTKPDFIYFDLIEWIYPNSMTDEEKANHPNYEITYGYLKTYSYKEAWKKAWNNAKKQSNWKTELNLLLNLPNFNKKVFKEITGIDVGKES